LFDRFEPGQMDSSEMEVVLLLDVSGSMAGNTKRLGEAAWAIRQAVDDLDGRSTVITWESGPHRVVADPSRRPDGRMFVPQSTGGTVPESALAEAFRLLAESTARIRMMVVLTDGAWDGYVPRQESIIKAMRAEGITTVLAYLPPRFGGTVLNPHHCEFAESIDEPHGLARLFEKVARDRITATW
jgi:uncharacterized protein with von Willebrand factor type A (vWA) domain